MSICPKNKSSKSRRDKRLSLIHISVRITDGRQLDAWKESSADYLLLDGGYGDGKVFDWSVAEKAKSLGKMCIRDSSVTSNCINPFKIACGNGIYALLNHFLTYCAVKAQYCVCLLYTSRCV